MEVPFVPALAICLSGSLKSSVLVERVGCNYYSHVTPFVTCTYGFGR